MRVSTRALFIMLDKIGGSALQILLGVTLVRLIDKDTYGAFREVLMVGAFVSAIAAFSIPESAYYFLPAVSGEERRKRLSLTLLLTMSLGLVAAVVVLFSADAIASSMHDPNLAWALRLFAIFPLVDLCRQTLTHALMATDRANISAGISLGTTVVRFGVIVATFALGWSMNLVFAAYLAVEVAGLLTLVIVQARSGGLALVRPDLVYYRELLGYCLPMAMAYGLGILSTYLGQFIIGFYFDQAAFAEYSNGARELPIAIFTQSIATAMMPNLVTHFKKGEIREMCGLFADGIRRSSLVILPVFVWAVLVSQDLMAILYPGYERSWYPFLIYLFILPVRVAIYNSMLRAMGRTAPIIWATVIFLVANVAITLALLEIGGRGLLGFMAPALGMTLALYLCAAYMTHLVRREVRRVGFKGQVFPVFEFLGTLGVAVAAGLLAWGGVYLVSWLSLGDLVARWTRVGVGAVVVGLAFIVLGHLTKVVQPQDWALLSSILRRFRPSFTGGGVDRGGKA